MIESNIAEKNNDKKRNIIEVVIFFTVTYGISLLFGIPLYFKEYMNPEILVIFMTILPASGVSIARLYKYKKNNKHIILNYVIIADFLLSLSLVMLKAFGIIDNETINLGINILVLFTGIATICYVCIEGKELYPFKNEKKSIKYIFSFIIIINLSKFIMLGCKDINFINLIMNIFLIFPYLATQSILFFGEEYGWRGFLQEKMQIKFGKRAGVILLGFIWELWHIPLWFTIYHVDGLGICIRLFSVISLSIFLGYVYMKTKNIWTCVMIHLINNTVFLDADLDNIFLNFNSSNLNSNIILGCLIFSVILSLFIFTKEYKSECKD
ncbi:MULTISPECIES: CPBP family intramembrane glutamic endopeptidase [Clostridioides]|uniref:CPBP family intramembrane glutamic endopeptidase n=1 Tax=Clostridioides sp. ZZV14-6387 TaxID=2811497 RepID=UPI0007BC0B23|nr:CPBP family intramembrane metalloprotease [Clostridioides sp. ZZV14-6387]MCI9977631.1 CPBP family intramembrane metalloprotease [Clostridioides difficile]NJI80801.1 CPBP family intramembrane metalloprotease [Clostridioides difficile]CZR96330.1 CAAX amino terminal protease self-immunity [Clostridioides difficile]CZS01154.1 CAAX amino terminal protease self-immunity [Clostridioides difficile]